MANPNLSFRKDDEQIASMLRRGATPQACIDTIKQWIDDAYIAGVNEMAARAIDINRSLESAIDRVESIREQVEEHMA